MRSFGDLPMNVNDCVGYIVLQQRPGCGGNRAFSKSASAALLDLEISSSTFVSAMPPSLCCLLPCPSRTLGVCDAFPGGCTQRLPFAGLATAIAYRPSAFIC